MKKTRLLSSIMLCTMLIFTFPVGVYASSLDDLVSEEVEETLQTDESVKEVEAVEEDVVEEKEVKTTSEKMDDYEANYGKADDFIDSIHEATNVSEISEKAAGINSGANKVISLLIQVISYVTVALLALRVVIDLLYIAIPFTRSLLANGYGGNAMSNGAAPMNGMNSGFGGTGFGGSSFGGFNRGFGGMNQMNQMNGMATMNNASQPGASPSMGRIQIVSTAALNAVASENTVGPTGKANVALKAYCKDMVIILVLTPILLVLAVSGALTDLGFLLGDVISKAVYSIGQMF